MADLNDTNKLADPENPDFGTRIWDMSPIQVELQLAIRRSSGLNVIGVGVSGSPFIVSPTPYISNLAQIPSDHHCSSVNNIDAIFITVKFLRVPE